MDAAADTSPAWAGALAIPRIDLDPFTPREIQEVLRGGEVEADLAQHALAWAARARGAIDVAIAEGLHALRQGDRLLRLGSHLDDYAREALGIGRRAAMELARLGRELARRPLLREAMRAGRVRLRAAQTLLELPAGEDEAAWVERAATLTVRALEAEVKRARKGAEEEERWFRLGLRMEPDERAVLDEALALAGGAAGTGAAAGRKGEREGTRRRAGSVTAPR